MLLVTLTLTISLFDSTVKYDQVIWFLELAFPVQKPQATHYPPIPTKVQFLLSSAPVEAACQQYFSKSLLWQPQDLVHSISFPVV